MTLIETRWMRAFVSVAQELNYSRAAARLHTTQPSVSQQVMDLEKSLGVRVFERTTRKVQLTEAGQAFLQECIAALSAIDRAESVARNAGDGEQGRLRMGFSSAFAGDYLPRLLSAVAERHPHMVLTLRGSQYSTQTLDELSDGSLELGCVAGPFNRHGLKTLLIDEQRLGVLLRHDHPLAAHAELRPRQLRDEAFILPPPGEGVNIRNEIVSACLDEGFHPHGVQETSDAMTFFLLVNTGIGICAGTTGAISLLPPTIVFRPIVDPTRIIPVYLAWRSPPRESAALRNVLRVARDLATASHVGSAAPG